MRCFLAVRVSEEVRKNAARLINEFEMRGVKTVEPDNLHWTVRFFGELGDIEVEKVKELMDSIEEREFYVEVGGLGVFPRESRAKVVWLGIGEGGEEFTEFLREVNLKFSELGGKSGVKPHLTLCRARSVKDRKKLYEKIEKFRDFSAGRMKVREIVLFESRLTPRGPVYREIKSVPLWKTETS